MSEPQTEQEHLVLAAKVGGLFRWIFGPLAETLGYLAPLLVTVTAVGIIAALEMMKRRA